MLQSIYLAKNESHLKLKNTKQTRYHAVAFQYFLLYMVGSFDHRPHKHSIFAGYVSMSFDILVDSLQTQLTPHNFVKFISRSGHPSYRDVPILIIAVLANLKINSFIQICIFYLNEIILSSPFKSCVSIMIDYY
jgi:hypothetical protein